MINLRDGLITDLIQNSMKHNPETQALAYAIREEKRRIMAWVEKTLLEALIGSLDERILDVLAVELRTPAYRDTYPLATKRALVAGTLDFYAHLGTPAAVERIISAIFEGGTVSEWFEYEGGKPHHFRIDIGLSGQAVTPEALTELRRLIEGIKRLTSWLDDITTETVFDPATLYITPVAGSGLQITTLPNIEPAWPELPLYITPVQGQGMSITTLPPLEPAISFTGAVRASPTLHTFSETRLPTLKDFDTVIPVVAYERTVAHFANITETRLPDLKEV